MKTRFGLEQKKNQNTRIEPAQSPTQRQKQKDTDKMGKFASPRRTSGNPWNDPIGQQSNALIV